MNLETNVSELKGVGPATKEKLEEMGIVTVGDLQAFEDTDALKEVLGLNYDKVQDQVTGLSGKEEKKEEEKEKPVAKPSKGIKISVTYQGDILPIGSPVPEGVDVEDWKARGIL